MGTNYFRVLNGTASETRSVLAAGTATGTATATTTGGVASVSASPKVKAQVRNGAGKRVRGGLGLWGGSGASFFRWSPNSEGKEKPAGQAGAPKYVLESVVGIEQ